MAQVVIWGHRSALAGRRNAVTNAVHGAIMAALQYPPEKRFHRFVLLDDEDFVHPEDRGIDYTIIEISMFEGRSEATKRALIDELFRRLEQEAGVPPVSLEITITETPRVNWGIRGGNAADLALGYRVDV
jgi:phenylpyruvate tautomerase PptA (4-oxalocrotonate tautomerase family)